MSTPAATPTPIDAATRLALLATGMAIFVVANDFTALAVALPQIERDFGVGVSTVQWTINAYALVVGVFMITGGRLADLLGRRRVFVTGAAIFAVFSMLGAVAPSIGVLIGARAAMGVGGALMWPATVGMIYSLLPESRRGLAGSLVIGVAGFGNATGPLLGGVLTEGLDWRFILLLNLPIAAAAIAVVLRTVTESRDPGSEPGFDWTGTALLTTSVLLLLLALDQVDAWGWGDARVVGALALSALLMLALVPVERRAGLRALLPPDVIGSRRFLASVITVGLMSMTFFTAMMYLPQFMEKLLGFSALGAGVGLLPLMAVFAIASFSAGPLYERVGGRSVIVAGAACLPVAMVLLSLLGAGSDYAVLIPGMLLLGIGLGLFYSAITSFAIASLDEARASLGGGILYMFQVAGGSIGLGIATTVVATVAGDEAAAGGSAGTAFADGVQAAMRVSAGLAVAGFVVALLFVGRRAATEH